jgi:hypothetical protein
MIKNIIAAFIIPILCFAFFSTASGYEKKSLIKEEEILKFRAHQEVERLQKENYKKLNLIEIISKNFGYTSYGTFKKDYWTARILVSKKQIIQAKYLFEKNKKDMDEALRVISIDYEKATQEMLEDCLNKLNEFEFTANIDADYATKKKIFLLRNKIKTATQQYDSAHDAFSDQVYVSSIFLYRNAKSYAINILKDLAEPDEKNKINDKFKIHIVDNRNEVYNKS